MRTVEKSYEELQENGEFYTYKSSETVKNDGTVDKNLSVSKNGINASMNYTKGREYNFHYETTEPKVVVPAFIIFSLVSIIIGVIFIIISINNSSIPFLIFGILWIIFTIIFMVDNLRKHGKSWYNELKNKGDK